jgi:[ribosomal protein S18]-alanine N-acetyltransferase
MSAGGFEGWMDDAGAATEGRAWALVPMTLDRVPLVAEVEKTAYGHPWSARHFEDSVRAGHWARLLVTEPDPVGEPPVRALAPRLPDGRLLLGYLVAMPGVDEVHLLNLTTVPAHRRQGCARLMLEALAAWSLSQGAHWLWLEVRAGNAPARALYESTGFSQVGLRRAYYPDAGARREDAVVMSLDLAAMARKAAA